MRSPKAVGVPFISLSPQHRAIRRDVLRMLTRVADSQKFVLGENGLELEKAIAKKAGVAHGVGLASGSDALFLALLALGVGRGDEVVTTPFTFFATAGSISRTGAKIVFCDIDPRTYNLDPSKLASCITRRTKAVIPVHLFGLPCDMRPILALAKKHHFSVVEDAAQSFGASYHGHQTGAMGDIGCYSFYPTKNLGGAGDGGMVVTPSAELADRIRLLRNHGSRRKYHHEMVGINSRLDELQAGWLLIKLRYIDQWNAARRRIAQRYDHAFNRLPVVTPFIPKGSVSNYHLYSILCEEREALSKHLDARGIGNGVYYPLPLHLQPCYKPLGYRVGDLPVSESVASKVLSLPMYAEMRAGEVASVIQAVRAFFSGAERT